MGNTTPLLGFNWEMIMSNVFFKRWSVCLGALLISSLSYADLQNVEVGSVIRTRTAPLAPYQKFDELTLEPTVISAVSCVVTATLDEADSSLNKQEDETPSESSTPELGQQLKIADLQNVEVGDGLRPRWKHPLQNWAKLESPLVEVTPFVFKEKLYLMESWQKQWENPGDADGSHFTKDEVRIRDMAADRIVSMPLIGHGLAMTLVHEGTAYVFAGNWGTEKKWNITEIVMTSSTDLKTWTKPVVVLKAQENEKFFNVSVCKGRDSFVLLVETNEPKWPAFTFKYFTSDNLTDWTRVPDALYGVDKYVGGPALYFEGDWYYTLYLQALGKGHYETRIARSKDLIKWIDAKEDRPFVTFQPENKVHPLRPAELREKNASDAEICYWNGKTIVYYTGGEQHYAGDLQYADFPGTPQALLEYYFK